MFQCSQLNSVKLSIKFVFVLKFAVLQTNKHEKIEFEHKFEYQSAARRCAALQSQRGAAQPSIRPPFLKPDSETAYNRLARSIGYLENA